MTAVEGNQKAFWESRKPQPCGFTGIQNVRGSCRRYRLTEAWTKVSGSHLGQEMCSRVLFPAESPWELTAQMYESETYIAMATPRILEMSGPKEVCWGSCSHRVQLARGNTVPTAGSRTGEARISKPRVWYLLCLVQYQSSLIFYSSFCPSLLWMGSQLAALRRDLGLLNSVETVRLWVLLKSD